MAAPGGDRGAVVAVAGEGERRIGEREDEAAVAGAVAVEHVGAHRHAQPRVARPHLLDHHAQALRGAVALEHRVGGALGETSPLMSAGPPASRRRRSSGEVR